MPSKPCQHPTCPNYVCPPADYCADHQADQSPRAERHRYYDQHHRDKATKQFYNSSEWQRARKTALTADPTCSRCHVKFADTVHHVVPVKEATPAQRLQQALLIPLCASCHAIIEREIKANGGKCHDC